MNAPAWLSQRDGDLRLGSDGKTWYVVLSRQPQYALTATPVGSQFGCVIRQTINGRRVETPGPFTSVDSAIQGGLEQLRKDLGWG